MAKKISKSDISEEDVFGAIRKSAEETIKIIDKLSESMRETATSIKQSVGGAKFDSAKSVDNFVKSTQQANKLQKEAIQLDQQRSKAVQERNKAMAMYQKRQADTLKKEQEQQKVKQQAIKTEQEQQKLAQQKIRTDSAASKEAERLRKIEERKAKTLRDEASAYKRLEKSVREQKNKSKELAAAMLELERAGKKNSKEWRQLAKEYRTTTKAAQEGDRTLKKIDSTVGDNFRNVGNYKSALQGLGKSFLALAGGFTVVSGIKGAFDIVKDFDQAQGDLLAISGKTEEQLAGLTAQAKELGATTQFSATQITEMQIELAKLGFTNDQISESTEAVANFAAATGAAIPEAAALAGSALRGFGLEASEMERVVSVMGVATTKTALDFSKLNTGLSTVAPVAKAFGFSIEDTTALLGQLANAGFDASSSATATRNILLNLADANGDLAKELGRPIRSADDLAEGLKELQEKGIDLGEALQLTDKRSVAAFQTFLDGSDKLVELRDSITDVNDELEDMAAKRLDTISGQFTLLESAWEGFILSVNEGSGAGELIKNVVGFIAGNLNTLMSVLFKVVAAWGLYKTAILASKAATFLMSGGLKQMYVQMLTSIKGLVGMRKAADGVTKGMQTAGKAMNAIPWVALITLALQFAQALYDAASGSAELREQEELRRRAQEAAQKSAEEGAAKANEEIRKQIANEERLARERIARGEDEAKVNEELLKKKEEIFGKEESRLKSLRLAEQKRWAELRNSRSEIERLNKVIDDNGLTSRKGREASKKLVDMFKDLGVTLVRTGGDLGSQLSATAKNIEPVIAAQETKINFINGQLETLGETQAEIGTQQVEQDAKYKKTKVSVKNINKELKDHNTTLKKTIDLADELLTLTNERRDTLRDIEKIRSERELRALDDQIEAEFLAQKTAVENTGEMDTEALDDLIIKKGEMKRQARIEETAFEITQLNDEYNQRFATLRTKLDEEKKVRLEAQKKTLEENLKIAGTDATKQADAQKRYKDALADIELQYQDQIAEIKQLELAEAGVVSDKIVALKEQEKNDLGEIQREVNDEINQKNDELINMQDSFWKQLFKLNEKGAKKASDAEKQMWQDRMDMAQLATDVLIMLSDKRISKLDEEIDAATKQADFLRQLAANGNIEAKDSLAEQERIIAEANRKKILEERRKAKIEFANTVFQTYGSKVQSGSKTPFQDTIRDVSLLQQFISAFTPTYLEGTEDTGSTGRGIDGKGGFHAILHPNERVMTKQQNAMVGDLSNEQLAKVAQDYQNGKLLTHSGATQIGQGWDSELVIKQLQSLEATIKNKPEHMLGVENVVQGAMDIVRTTRSGKDVIHNRYRLKK